MAEHLDPIVEMKMVSNFSQEALKRLRICELPHSDHAPDLYVHVLNRVNRHCLKLCNSDIWIYDPEYENLAIVGSGTNPNPLKD